VFKKVSKIDNLFNLVLRITVSGQVKVFVLRSVQILLLYVNLLVMVYIVT